MAFTKFKIQIKRKPLRRIYIVYWLMLAYILAALVFWYFALDKQNIELSTYKLGLLDPNDISYALKVAEIKSVTDRKTAQYLGEGVTFFLLIIAGAILVFRMVKRQLVQSQQQQNFMMAITHELKTPIAVTKLNLETMQMRQLDHEQQQRLIRSTIQEANRLNALCNNMLLLSQMDTGGYTITSEKVDLGALAEDCMEDLRIRFPNRKIQSETGQNLFIDGDKLLLQLAINNLLDNAIKYSDKDEIVSLKAYRDNKYIRLQVIDEGKGIAKEEQTKIFEKYYRGRQRQTKGTGLGLYLSKKIVRQHHGEIDVAANEPRGSVFEIKFKVSRI